MTNMVIADVILGIKITRISERYNLSQSHYIEKILGRMMSMLLKLMWI